MIMLDTQPKMVDLRRVINKVRRYPVRAGEIVDIAQKNHAPEEVSDFYRSFHSYETFTDKEDLLTRTEHLEVMHRSDSTNEILSVAQED